jgi:hypothetical protein
MPQEQLHHRKMGVESAQKYQNMLIRLMENIRVPVCTEYEVTGPRQNINKYVL